VQAILSCCLDITKCLVEVAAVDAVVGQQFIDALFLFHGTASIELSANSLTCLTSHDDRPDATSIVDNESLASSLPPTPVDSIIADLEVPQPKLKKFKAAPKSAADRMFPLKSKVFVNGDFFKPLHLALSGELFSSWLSAFEYFRNSLIHYGVIKAGSEESREGCALIRRLPRRPRRKPMSLPLLLQTGRLCRAPLSILTCRTR
jgi:hypothetical protein